MGNRWRRQEGTVEHPYSALNLRLVLASFGLVTMIALTLVLMWLGNRGFALVTAVIAVVAVINVVVVQRRRQQRRQLERSHGEEVKHSLFE
jgi:uncharacterized membrane protein YqjE